MSNVNDVLAHGEPAFDLPNIVFPTPTHIISTVPFKPSPNTPSSRFLWVLSRSKF